jgi:hypothetical protein
MMRFGKISLAALAASTLAIAPVAAQAKDAAKPVVAKKVDRAGAERKGEKNLKGSAVLLALLALVAMVGGIVLAAGNSSDTPTSP